MRFRIGADVEYGLSNHIALRSGLRYVTSGFKSVINPKELSYNDMIDPQTGFIYQTSEMVPYLETTYHDYQIELPIVIKYFPKTKMGFHINGGLSILYFYKTVVTPNVYQPQHTHNLSRTLIGLNSGIGYDWKVSTKYFLSVDFLFRLNLTQTFAEPTFIHDSKAFSIGTEIGFGRILGNKTSE